MPFRSCSMFFGVPTAPPERERGYSVGGKSSCPGHPSNPLPLERETQWGRRLGLGLCPRVQVPPYIHFPVCDWSRAHLLFPRSAFLSSPSPFALLCPYWLLFFPPEWCCQARHNRELHPTLQFAAVLPILTFPLNITAKAMLLFCLALFWRL